MSGVQVLQGASINLNQRDSELSVLSLFVFLNQVFDSVFAELEDAIEQLPIL